MVHLPWIKFDLNGPGPLNLSTWTPEFVQLLSRVAEVLLNVLLKKRSEEKLKRAFLEIKQLKDQLESERNYLLEEIQLEHNFENIIGQSQPLQYALLKVEQVAPTDTTALILGETGTGKELLSRAIHDKSRRKERPLIKVNCASLSSNLIESELFGHEKGAFTGAHSKRKGRFELADGATLFLDEIGELPLETQSKLLRVLQEGEFERMGSSHTIKVDVRIIAATNRNLAEEVKAGRFRKDLWYRLNVFPITAPPLCQCWEDIPLIANSLLKKFCKKIGKQIESISDSTMKTLEEYSWPGNIRELENVIERAVISSSSHVLRLAEKLEKNQTELLSEGRKKTMHEMERDYIIEILEETKWKIGGKKGAADILNLPTSTLRARVKKLGIMRP
ncbi:MAG: sigma 54-interacting transcriptional regulator [Deltaproteobacteria bacterium]|nr:sigma 54-interacting transcriptional regulator [Deltaproteobacteria bacterium]